MANPSPPSTPAALTSLQVLWDKAPPFIKHLVIRGPGGSSNGAQDAVQALAGDTGRSMHQGRLGLGRREDPEDLARRGPACI
ncbi:hypothetical protein GQ602_007393 [Ophiocordyceps camponoti-floridani]|uniref:Uncharacterized protein n=1 Tax=Ophiocordyceps camponoti-floridani TaxID=2030778 RepID=A0A8H4Q1B3_9HYPO|nr:hypothetical protein GQ602_007393 [Ophiocordyceps camponoti-floridani]